REGGVGLAAGGLRGHWMGKGRERGTGLAVASAGRDLAVLDQRRDDRPARLCGVLEPFRHGDDQAEDRAQGGEEAEHPDQARRRGVARRGLRDRGGSVVHELHDTPNHFFPRCRISWSVFNSSKNDFMARQPTRSTSVLWAFLERLSSPSICETR